MEETTKVEAPPEKLSQLIVLAIKDARKLDRKTYTPDCWVWHIPGRNNKCRVCLAGAVIAGTLGENPTTAWETDDIPGESKAWHAALYAIDSARSGDWSLALNTLGMECSDATMKKLKKIRRPNGVHFSTWAELRKHLVSMTRCARELEQLGL